MTNKEPQYKHYYQCHNPKCPMHLIVLIYDFQLDGYDTKCLECAQVLDRPSIEYLKMHGMV